MFFSGKSNSAAANDFTADLNFPHPTKEINVRYDSLTSATRLRYPLSALATLQHSQPPDKIAVAVFNMVYLNFQVYIYRQQLECLPATCIP
jgi:hypothetical protein